MDIQWEWSQEGPEWCFQPGETDMTISFAFTCGGAWPVAQPLLRGPKSPAGSDAPPQETRGKSPGSCGPHGHLVPFSVSGSGADMSPNSGQRSPLSTLTKKHSENQFLPSVSCCHVCQCHSLVEVSPRQTSRAGRWNKPELLMYLTCWISQLCTVLPVLFFRWNDTFFKK